MKPRNLTSGSNLAPISHLAPLPGSSAALWLALASAPLLLAGMQLRAQQPVNPAYQQYGYGYGSQNPPSSPPGYAQPQYAPPQPYPQPPYGQQPQPSYSQPQYGYGQQPQDGTQQPYAASPQPYAGPQPYAPPQPYAQQLPSDEGQGYANQPDADQDYAQQPVTPQPPLTPDQLEQLVAPIALYPDALLAQILTASTYPAQVAVADQWLRQMQAQGYASPDQVAAGADTQSWDPSVKGLTAFPRVLDMMNRNLHWTTELGNAYYNQPQDVMQTVQVLRQRAQNAGTLESTPQESVTGDQGAIELAPPSPEYVYVPTYDPWAVYGAPIAPYPGFSFAGALGAFFGPALRFGPAIAMAAFDRMPFGWIGWGLSWLAHAVFFHHATYFTHSPTVADWGFPRGGPRAFGGYARGEYARSAQPARGPGSVGSYGRQSQFDRGNAYARGNTYPRGNAFASGNESNRSGEYRGAYASPRLSYGRPLQEAYNRPTPAFSHPQTYGGAYERYGNDRYAGGRDAYGYAARPGQSYAGADRYAAPSRSIASPYGYYRSPQSTYQRAYAEAPSRGFAESGRSGGFHPFSRGSEHESFARERAPKGYSGGHFGGHSSGHAERGGDHFGGHSGGGGHKHR